MSGFCDNGNKFWVPFKAENYIIISPSRRVLLYVFWNSTFSLCLIICAVPVNENVFMWCKTSGCLSGSQRSIECCWIVGTSSTETDSCETWQRIVILTSMVLRILAKEPMPSRILRTRAAFWMVCSASLLSLAAFARIISSSVNSASVGYTTHINKLSLCDNVGWLLELGKVFWHSNKS